MGLPGNKKWVNPMSAARILHWALILAGYQYTIKYRCNKDNSAVDAMSRLPAQPKNMPVPRETILLMEGLDNTLVSVEDVQLGTRQDSVLSRAYQTTLHGWPECCSDDDLQPYFAQCAELGVYNGCLLWGSRVVMPPMHRKAVMMELHQMHSGIVTMKALSRSYAWWPGMDKDLEAKVHNCRDCQEHQKAPVGGTSASMGVSTETLEKTAGRLCRTGAGQNDPGRGERTLKVD